MNNSADLEDIASTWAVRRHAGLTPDMERKFQQWLKADPRHYAAFAEADLALSVLAPPLDESGRGELRKELARRARQRTRRWISFVAAAAIAAAIAVVLVPQPEKAVPLPPTMVPKPLQQTLSDGSVVQLNAEAEINEEFTAETRAVRLVKGEAHFAVAKNPNRPFVVLVGPVRVHAVGTAFNIRYAPVAVDVLVTEGKVRVSETAPAPSAPPCEADLVAGTRTVIDLGKAPAVPVVSKVSSAEVARSLAWRGMRFELSNATLDETVQVFNRKTRVQLTIDDDSLRALRLSGIYWVDNPEQFTELIESTLDVVATHTSADHIVLRRR